jgi:hypothetical protein
LVETNETFATSQGPASVIPSEVATEAPSFSSIEIKLSRPSIFPISKQPSMTPTTLNIGQLRFETHVPSNFPPNFPAVSTTQPSKQEVATKDPLLENLPNQGMWAMPNHHLGHHHHLEVRQRLVELGDAMVFFIIE